MFGTHNQVVSLLDIGLQISATDNSTDDIEALETENGAPLITTQFHPEIAINGLPNLEAIYHHTEAEQLDKNKKIIQFIKKAGEAYHDKKQMLTGAILAKVAIDKSQAISEAIIKTLGYICPQISKAILNLVSLFVTTKRVRELKQSEEQKASTSSTALIQDKCANISKIQSPQKIMMNIEARLLSDDEDTTDDEIYSYNQETTHESLRVY